MKQKKSKYFIIFLLVLNLFSCSLPVQKCYLFFSNDSEDIITEISIKKNAGRNFSVLWVGIIFPDESKIIEIPEGNYYIRAGGFDDCYNLSYHKTNSSAEYKPGKPIYLLYNGTEILYE